ncbi:MAG: spore germination protein [Firmicutes bacterium]|nr:spore germination protein [Bacillota bacterium]
MGIWGGLKKLRNRLPGGAGRGGGRPPGQTGKRAAQSAVKSAAMSSKHQGPPRPPEKLTGNLDRDLQMIKGTLGRSDDIIIRVLNVAGRKDARVAVISVDGMTDRAAMDRDILESLMYRARDDKIANVPKEDIPKAIMDYILQLSEVMELESVKDIFGDILSGNAALIFDGYSKAVSVNLKGWQQRSVQQPISEPAVRGPRDGFVENIRTNTALIRRRINDPNLIIRSLKIGSLNPTHIALVYIDGVADSNIVSMLEEKIKGIKADQVFGTGSLEELLTKGSMSLFPKALSTERPDRVAGGLLQGQISIVIDNSPFVLVVPAVLTTFFQASDDYYHRSPIATYIRIIRLVGWALGLFLPGLYVALAAVNPDVIPLGMAMAISASREGIPYPAFVEVLIMDIAMELLSEASTRLPTYIGASATVVGGLIIGTAAAQARIISNIMIIVVAATAIGIFVTPNYELALAWRISKFLFTFFAAVFGLYGLSAAFIFLLLFLVAQDSFGVPYLTPLGPFKPADFIRDVFIRAPWWSIISRRPRTFLAQTEEVQARNRPGAAGAPEAGRKGKS